MPSGLPTWDEALAQITAFVSLDLVHGVLLFIIAIAGGALFVMFVIWALSSRK